MMFHRFGGGYWGGMGIIGPIVGLVMFVAVVVLLVLGIRWFERQSTTRTSSVASTEAMDIARRRLASGEITIQEFEEIEKRLRT